MEAVPRPIRRCPTRARSPVDYVDLLVSSLGTPMNSVDKVYHSLREAIVQGWYLPGAPLRLNDLTEQYGVSLIPIREALRRLEVERLVETEPNRGARVASIADGDVADAYATRELLEVEALNRAWDRLDAYFVEEARRTLAEMFDAFERGDLAAGALAHRRYHFEMFGRAESPWLDHLIRILWSHTERYRNHALVLHTPTRSSTEYHLRLLDAIAAGDRELAISSTREELTRAAEVVISHLERRLKTSAANH